MALKQLNIAAGIIRNASKEIFITQRDASSHMAGFWEFPGGKIEAGETKQEALKREILEELGCVIEVFNPVEDTTYEYEKVIVRLETFMARVIEGVPKVSEHAELKWVPKDMLYSLNWAPADIPAIEKLSKP